MNVKKIPSREIPLTQPNHSSHFRAIYPKYLNKQHEYFIFAPSQIISNDDSRNNCRDRLVRFESLFGGNLMTDLGLIGKK